MVQARLRTGLSSGTRPSWDSCSGVRSANSTLSFTDPPLTFSSFVWIPKIRWLNEPCIQQEYTPFPNPLHRHARIDTLPTAHQLPQTPLLRRPYNDQKIHHHVTPNTDQHSNIHPAISVHGVALYLQMRSGIVNRKISRLAEILHVSHQACK